MKYILQEYNGIKFFIHKKSTNILKDKKLKTKVFNFIVKFLKEERSLENFPTRYETLTGNYTEFVRYKVKYGYEVRILRSKKSVESRFEPPCLYISTRESSYKNNYT